MAAYFKMINDQGGINGRKINFISYDDGYTPPKTVEMTRKLVESDQVLFARQPARHPDQQRDLALHEREEGAAIVRQHRRHQMGRPERPSLDHRLFQQLPGEGRIYAAYILKNKPDGKIGVLYQNDDFGKDYLKGLVDGLGDKAASMIKVKASYETTDPTVDSQIVDMKAAGCDVLVNTAIPKFARPGDQEGGRDRMEAAAHPEQHRNSSVGATLKPAGLENAKGIISDFFLKDPTDPQWQERCRLQMVGRVHGQILPERRQERCRNVYGASVAATTVQVLKQCGDELTRENVMKQAANLHDLERADAAARDHDQHQPDRFRADQAGPDGAFRRRALRTFRPAC